MDTTEDWERCDARNAAFIVTCDLPRGHVKSKDDWHVATATRRIFVETNSWTREEVNDETARWAPNQFEIPRPGDDE